MKKHGDLDGLRKKARIKGNQRLVYHGPCTKELFPIQVSNEMKNFFEFEAFLQRKMSNDKFKLDPEVIHEFSIGEYFEPDDAEPEPDDTSSDDVDLGLSDMFG